jgi:dTDP-4-amino-4,6-dideoxygalactose transaminase
MLARHCPSVTLQERPPNGVYSILPVLLPAHVRAQEIQGRLAAQGIETRRWYCPTLDNHTAFRDVQIAGEFKVSRVLSERLLALPFHPFLGADDVESVCAVLASLLRTD